MNLSTYHTGYTAEGKAFTGAYHARFGTHPPPNKLPITGI
jgi:hypothetical protein